MKMPTVRQCPYCGTTGIMSTYQLISHIQNHITKRGSHDTTADTIKNKPMSSSCRTTTPSIISPTTPDKFIIETNRA